VCTVLYIAHSQERSQVVSDLLGHFASVKPICYAADGLEALTLVNLCKPDVVLLDALLKKISGLEVARTLAHTQSALKSIVVEEYLQQAEILTILHEILPKSTNILP
jgi:chemotaxis response regulator CheB